MKFEPGTFYFGVVDFFSTLLPGALLAYFLNGPLGPRIFGTVLPTAQGEIAGGAIFFFAAYLLGHITFLIGSSLDRIYTPIRRRLVLFKHKNRTGKEDVTYLRATAIKRKFLSDENEDVVNTFEWAKAMLLLKHPSAMAEVARL